MQVVTAVTPDARTSEVSSGTNPPHECRPGETMLAGIVRCGAELQHEAAVAVDGDEDTIGEANGRILGRERDEAIPRFDVPTIEL